MLHHSDHNLPSFSLQRADNGFILQVNIPYDYDKNAAMMEMMTDKIIKANNKIQGDDYKNQIGEPVFIPQPPKTDFTYVCKDEKEVIDRIQEFFKMSK